MQSILTVNGGSSSIRFAVYETGATLRRRLGGKIDRIGAGGTNLIVDDSAGKRRVPRRVAVTDHRMAATFLLDWLEEQPVFASVKAVGHRVVQGMQHSEPELVTPKLLAELHRITRYDPDHLPREIELIEALRQRHPKLPQVACFDTAFHRTMPQVAKLLPIPRHYMAQGVERYGFHGLSYAYLMEELARIDPVAAKGRAILAHLGNGASVAAVRHGKSIDTSMGFTPASGLVMSTRTGDLDPGLVYYLARTRRMTAAQFQRMVNHKSGLLGVSGTSSDMRDLLAREAGDVRASEAVALFCYQAKKWIGSYAAVLGGLDTLVFAGGIGESAPLIRERICDGLGFLGIKLSRRRNAKNAAVISTSASRTTVRVMRTDEELMIARSVSRSRPVDTARTKKPQGH
ncbi:MAG: acetate/propionate family kinase [Methylacidiphilales bacterium]|nr:acetate/propionate family kinase [Candidatus Methylacidiphilales bacterium]